MLHEIGDNILHEIIVEYIDRYIVILEQTIHRNKDELLYKTRIDFIIVVGTSTMLYKTGIDFVVSNCCRNKHDVV